MTNKKYEPSDFQLPEEVCPYSNTLGKSEFEQIAAYIIESSIDAGKWKPAGRREFYKISELIHKEVVNYMVDVGLLEKVVSGYMLSRRALEQIAEKYSVQNQKLT